MRRSPDWKRMYKQRNYENLTKKIFKGIGQYQVPAIKPTQYTGCKWVGFNYAAGIYKRKGKGIHFFLDDYQFKRLWNEPDHYTAMLQDFDYVMAPDFSLYTDFPKAVQIYNHYRKHWLAAYWQSKGVNVIPTIGWSDEESYEWCFDGEPKHCCVAISSVGCMMNQNSKKLFLAGYEEMIKRLEPEQIIFYGKVPDECKGNIVRIKAFQEKFNEVQCNGW